MITNIHKIFKGRTWGMAVASSTLLAACGSVPESAVKPIKIDGSSKVFPITEIVLETYKSEAANQSIKELKIEGEFSGTGGGFQKFCAGETDISAASRPISQEEMATCKNNEISYIELPIAFDAITVVVNPNNNWSETLTVEQLKTLWEPAAENQVGQWNQVDSSYPDRPLTLYGPDQLSGTYDYFTKAIVGETGASRQDYVKSMDDEVLVTGVSQDPNAIAYFGYGYYQQHQDKLKAVAIDNGNGGVLPSPDTVENEEYAPLSRPLFLYVNAKRAQENPALEIFVEYYLNKAPELVAEAGYIPLPEDVYHIAKVHLQQFDVGSVFEGSPQVGLTISDLMRQPTKF
ncbi:MULTISPECIES: PstS family phosphate ABC transporter substrate-binding protein [Crocosphaera]|uniref:Phosphate-binding protein n=2 Tax=Crocosphaera watsonii TaxID=263511 RepID=T2JHK3_CROWT|nr:MULTISPECIES: PstS family phosphate ABC transporter substrate-binding protein [Crocosphaera]MCH2245294.1 PstS family phosphate ABC transporter substrate-binding protein [Crocosphaera sp.]CCQ65298.1 Phosphate ABC transporter, periplasmic phosphate-binding protein PstS (TC 3.A.1.7.1) [Crocosphaera watsonii WH 0402]